MTSSNRENDQTRRKCVEIAIITSGLLQSPINTVLQWIFIECPEPNIRQFYKIINSSLISTTCKFKNLQTFFY